MGHRQIWTQGEVASLRAWLTVQPQRDVTWIAGTLGRTETAIRAKARKLGLTQKPQDFSEAELASRLGVSAATVKHWRRERWLPQMTHAALRRMLKAHPDVLDAEKVDLAWVIGVIAA